MGSRQSKPRRLRDGPEGFRHILPPEWGIVRSNMVLAHDGPGQHLLSARGEGRHGHVHGCRRMAGCVRHHDRRNQAKTVFRGLRGQRLGQVLAAKIAGLLGTVVSYDERLSRPEDIPPQPLGNTTLGIERQRFLAVENAPAFDIPINALGCGTPGQ